MEYRFIQGKELERISPIFEKYGWSPLDPIFSKVLIAEENEEIVGFLGVQLMIRTEPMWIEPLHRGQGIAKELATKMDKQLKEDGVNSYFCSTDNPAIAKLCKEMGMILQNTYKMEKTID